MRHYITQAEQQTYLGSRWYRRVNEIRGAAAQLIGAQAREVAFVKNTSEGICYVASGINWVRGDNVITTSAEFPSNMYPWMALRDRGVELRVVEEESGRVPAERIIEMIDGDTRLVSVSAVQYASGYRVDLKQLGAACQQQGVLLCVDAIQSLGVHPIDVKEMKIDFLSSDGHKWLCGPEGAGIFYCRRELLSHLTPSEPGWMCMINADDYSNYQFEFRDDAGRFEPGSYNVVGIHGLGAAIELIHRIGTPAIEARVMALTDRLVAGLEERGVRVASSRRPGEGSGIVSFEIENKSAEAAAMELESERRIIVAARDGRLRVSPHVYNTEEEIDSLLAALPLT
jgi:selenocysteine lyase/cysteine desulfurase